MAKGGGKSKNKGKKGEPAHSKTRAASKGAKGKRQRTEGKPSPATSPPPTEKAAKKPQPFVPPKTPEEFQRARRGVWNAVFLAVGVFVLYWTVVFLLVPIPGPH